MASITLDGNSYDHILDVNFIEINKVALPEWVNDAGPDVDTNVWDLQPLQIEYKLRVTDAEKWVLDQIMTGHAVVQLTDSIYDITTQNVFMIRINSRWQGAVNHANPWEVTITLVFA